MVTSSEPPPPAAEAPPPPAQGTQSAAGLFGWIDRLNKAALLASTLIAIGAFIASLYFPEVRRWFDPRAKYWYNIGLLVTPPHYTGYRPRPFEHPAWGDGRLNLGPFYRLRGKIIFSEGRYVGRKTPGPDGDVATIGKEGTCLRISEISFHPYRTTPDPGKPADPFLLSQILVADDPSGRRTHDRLRSMLPEDFRTQKLEDCLPKIEGEPPTCPRVAVWAEARRVSCEG